MLMKKMLKYLLLPPLAFVLYFVAVLLIAYFKDYKPERIERLSLHSPEPKEIMALPLDTFSIMSWNIGYAGLGAEEDFFYDGGQMVRPTEERINQNLTGISDFLLDHDNVSFILLQEVDRGSKRSYEQDQEKFLLNELWFYSGAFAPNYKVPFVPVPLFHPMGSVLSGLLSLSLPLPVSSERYAFEGNFAFPKKLFMLDRCFILSRFQMTNRKQLVIINTHNSAFDDGSLRLEQLDKLRQIMTTEYKKGNYIIIGGDWNMAPGFFKAGMIRNGDKAKENPDRIPTDWLPKGWSYVTEHHTPTNRSVATSYEKGQTEVQLIDFFVVSPNLQPLAIKNTDLSFKYSDHQPVLMQFTFKK